MTWIAPKRRRDISEKRRRINHCSSQHERHGNFRLYSFLIGVAHCATGGWIILTGNHSASRDYDKCVSPFGHCWVSQDDDALHYRVWARNLRLEPQSLVMFVRLYRGETPEDLKGSFITFNVKAVRTKGRAPNVLGYEDGLFEGALDIGGLTPVLYTLRFGLYQDNLLQDTKIITFCTTRWMTSLKAPDNFR